jgi:hypothetical protein
MMRNMSTPDVVELQRSNSDLARILELATTWKGSDSTAIADSLLNMLLGMLDLDLVYLRLDEAAHSFIRVSAALSLETSPEEVSDMLAGWHRD